MAFGDLIKSAVSLNVDSNTKPCDLLTSPSGGNLLLFRSGVGTGSGAVGTPPLGFTLGALENSGSLSTAWYWKISDGTEQVVTITWSPGQTTSCASEYLEYEWDSSVPIINYGEDLSNIDINVSSQSTGSVTPPSSPNIVVFMVVADRGNGMETGGVWSSSILDLSMQPLSRCVGAFGHLVNQSGLQSDTWASTDSGEQAYGTVISFATGAGGTGDTTKPVISRNPPDITNFVSGNASSYVDAGFTALDDTDGALTPTITGLPTDFIGGHTVRANVSDAAGNAADEVTRTVNATVPVGYSYILLSNPDLIDPAKLLFGYTGGDAPVSGDQLVAKSDGVAITLEADGGFSFVTVPTVTTTVGRYVIKADGTIGIEAPFVYSVGGNKPVIQRNGSAIVSIESGSTYTDAGFTATDVEDGALTPIITGAPTNYIGTHIIRANVTDSDSQAADEVTRTVNVTVPTNYKYIDLINPDLIDSAKLLFGYTGGDAPVTGDQLVVIPSDIDVVLEADGGFSFVSIPTVSQTVNRYVIKADGTIGIEAPFVYSVGAAPIITSQNSFSAPELQNTIGTVVATDAIGFNLSGADAALLNISSFGVLTLATGNLDFETKPTYTVDVEAFNASGSSPIQTLTINVTNVIEGVITDASDSTIEYPFNDVGIMDSDPLISGWRATFTNHTGYSITDNFGAVVANISGVLLESNSPYTYTFTLNDALDVIGVVAVYEGADTSVPPTFTSTNTLSIPEDALDGSTGGAGVPILTLTATGTGEIVFDIIGGGLGVDYAQYEITNEYLFPSLVLLSRLWKLPTPALDFETDPQHVIEVRARGDSQQSTNQIITINVTNVVEIAPTITPDGSQVLELFVGDAFSNPSWTWNDDVVSGQTVTWTGVVDVNTAGSYTRTATATNAIDTTTLDYTVNVSAVPVAPTISSSATLTSAEGLLVVGVVIASGDADIAFSLTGGVDADSFTIDSVSGVLSYIIPPNFEEDPTDKFVQVTATNGAGTDVQDITVSVSNVLELAPTITPTAGIEITITEGSLYTNPSWTWNDDVTSGNAVAWSGAVDNNTVGVYIVTATATNAISPTTLDYTVNVVAAASTVSIVPRIIKIIQRCIMGF